MSSERTWATTFTESILRGPCLGCHECVWSHNLSPRQHDILEACPRALTSPLPSALLGQNQQCWYSTWEQSLAWIVGNALAGYRGSTSGVFTDNVAYKDTSFQVRHRESVIIFLALENRTIYERLGSTSPEVPCQCHAAQMTQVSHPPGSLRGFEGFCCICAASAMASPLCIW